MANLYPPLKGLLVVVVDDPDDNAAMEKMQAYRDFCVAAAGKFSVEAKIVGANREDLSDVAEWLDALIFRTGIDPTSD